MPAILIDDAEWSLLMGEPAELTKLYVALKRRMDFATGVAGRKTLLNEIVLREGFTVAPIPGRPKPRPITREMYRSAMRRLERLGLVVPIDTMVFEFPHARRDRPSKTATTELQPDSQPQQQPSSNQPEPSNNGAFEHSEQEPQPELEPTPPASCNLLPESGIPPTALSAREQPDAFEPRQRFPMHDDWQPTPSGWKATAFRNGLGATPIDPDVLREFRSYWFNRPDKHQTQGQWEHDLAQAHLRSIRHGQSAAPGTGPLQANTHSQRPPRGKGAGSALDRVYEGIAARDADHAVAGSILDPDD
ncbi:DnaT-like ssDNA-binding domain-containing protein [Pseudomonas tohonis]|uniref:DnaT-like ssDNA-binding domain-containing protein n=1 Tax=Pseudomonas tohonis TaxID=2725477 RepID=UPI001EEF26BA|nr:DnaT-like ssDNA-binding domain-containing protein [Pseudomonas tohonis]